MASARKMTNSARAWQHVAVDVFGLVAIMLAVHAQLWSLSAVLTSQSMLLGVPVALGVIGSLMWEGLYDDARGHRWPSAVALVGRAVLVGAATFALAGFAVAIGDGARRWVVIVSALWFVHLGIHHGVRAAVEKNLSRVIVAGSSSQAIEMRNLLLGDRRRAHHVIGFVVDEPQGQTFGVRPRRQKCQGHNPRDSELGTISDLPSLVDVYDADQVIFCMDGLTGGRFAPMARILSRKGIHVGLTGLGDIAPRRVDIGHIEGHPIIAIEPSSPYRWQLAVKRAVDVVVAGFALVVLSPLMAVVALAIRLVDGVSPIFRQPRVGKGGELFTIYKFQTMVQGAEDLKIDLTNELDGPIFKMESDPRITRLGSILRKTSIDELPQLLNVMRGDMSLVGPRPFIQSEVESAPEGFREREAVTPGMTGAWQVSGRSDTDFDELDELDRWYVDNWSLGEDLGILAKTVPAVLRQKGAR